VVLTDRLRPDRPDEGVLNNVQRRALESLRRDGVATVGFAEIFPDPARWADVADDIGGFAVETERRLPGMSPEERKEEYGKAFLVRRFRTGRGGRGSERRVAGPADRWVRLGISSEFLGIVNTYRGRLMRLNDLDNWYTVPGGGEVERVASQRWHRDGWEDHIVKVFTYFSDVDEAAGPFEYVRGSATGGKYGLLWPWEEKEVYPPQDEFESAIPEEDRVTLTGPAGTVVFCDTSGFHRGGFARSRPRILSYHTYLSSDAQGDHRRKFDVDWSTGSEELPRESRYALE
jgi:Phytanoyl-CoA dioxygenase (PhyH)